ncbi:poly-gamma-glutamate synthase PgsB [Leptospira wolffii]|uniref:poly-gamma-glutamate synthase PgsB n=1 Tax=Leptospira wolffii TaxID=409998 RepID=UPI00068D1EC7|nr:poly-gamma-glutamate synthase PgsB [Leptospira wolffii]
MSGFLMLAFSLSIFLFFGLLEYRNHSKRRDKIRIRIHVNGTRGKSSVTRLIASGLRAGGYRVVAKITGTLPRLILPDGSERDIIRFGYPNIIEQKILVREASENDAEVLVSECMALLPFHQWISEEKFIKATHYVITNVLEDHLEIMGPEKLDVALAFSSALPFGGSVFSSEKEYGPLLEKLTKERNSDFYSVVPEDLPGEEEMKAFGYLEHPENVGLALNVCLSLGVSREKALQGMWEALPDPGANTTVELASEGKLIRFVNGFAANDPDSARKAWNFAVRNFPGAEKRIALVNCRKDRQERSRQLAEEISDWIENSPDLIVCIGEATRSFLIGGRNRSIPILDAEGKIDLEVFQLLHSISSDRTLIVGLGNIADLGLQLSDLFRVGAREFSSI